jgi:hypothetical protein
MIEFTTSTGSFIAVSVPDDSRNHNFQTDGYLAYQTRGLWAYVKMEKGEIIGLTSSILKSEELSEQIIEAVADTSRQGYCFPYGHNKRPFKFSKATYAVKELFDSHGIVTEALIIKKQIV